jgi:sugar lactone lactonase YvrE
VFVINPTSGARGVLTSNGFAGPRLENPWDVAVAPSGEIFIVDAGNMRTTASVMSVNPTTGRRRMISQNTNPVGGPSFVFPKGITVDATGSILVSDSEAFGGGGGIIRVDPGTGVRTTVSSNTLPVGGPTFVDPGDLVVDSCGTILITDTGTSSVYRVDASSGVRAIASDNLTPPGTPTFSYNYGIAVR